MEKVSAFLLGWLLGILTVILYGAYRATRSDGWDDSNVLNWLRLLSQVYIHPEDFGRMYYEDGSKPFWYISGDEFADNVKTRPPNG